MNYGNLVNLSKEKRINLFNKPIKLLVPKPRDKNLGLSLTKNKIRNNNNELFPHIFKTDKKVLPKNNSAFKMNIKRNKDKGRLRLKSAIINNRNNNFIKGNININIKPNNLFKKEEIKIPSVLKENQILKNDQIKFKIRPFSSYHKMKKEEKKGEKMNLLHDNNNKNARNFWKLKQNVHEALIEKRVMKWFDDYKKYKNNFNLNKGKIVKLEKNFNNIKNEEKKNKDDEDQVEKERNKARKEKIRLEKEQKKIEEERKKREEEERKQREDEEERKRKEELEKKKKEEERIKREVERRKKEEQKIRIENERKKKEEEEKIRLEKERKKKEEQKIRLEKERKKKEEEERKKIEKEKKEKEEKEKREKEEKERKEKQEKERKKREEEERKKKEEEKIKLEEQKRKAEKEKSVKTKKSKNEEKGIKGIIGDAIISFFLKELKYDEKNQNENISKTRPITTGKPNMKLDKDLCDKKVSSLPKREKTNLTKFKNTIKSETENLTEIERAFVLFKWIGQNIDYDVKNKNLGKRVDCSKEGVFKTGKTVCSGYSNLFEDIALFINLKVKSVACYAKGAGYLPGQKIYESETNHEYNVINLEGNWYPIDSTWGSGHSIGNHYRRQFNEFYFLADPELLIKSHFPSNINWQLTKRIYTLEEFEKWPAIDSTFYQCGFRTFSPEEGLIELKNSNTQKFTIFGDNIKNKGLKCSIYLLDSKNKEKDVDEKLSFIHFYDNKIEIDCIFNKKGKYFKFSRNFFREQ